MSINVLAGQTQVTSPASAGVISEVTGPYQIKIASPLVSNNNGNILNTSIAGRFVTIRRSLPTEETRFIVAASTDTLGTVSEAWDNPPAIGDTYDISYNLDDLTTADVTSANKVYTAAQRLVITDTGFLGMSGNNIFLTTLTNSSVDGDIVVEANGRLMIGYKDEGTPNGGITLYLRNGVASLSLDFKANSDVSIYNAQFISDVESVVNIQGNCILKDVELINIVFSSTCDFTNAIIEDLKITETSGVTFSSDATFSHTTFARSGTLSTSSLETQTINLVNPTFINGINDLYIDIKSNKTWNLHNPNWDVVDIADRFVFSDQTPDSEVNELYTSDVSVQDVDAEPVPGAAIRVIENSIVNDIVAEDTSLAQLGPIKVLNTGSSYSINDTLTVNEGVATTPATVQVSGIINYTPGQVIEISNNDFAGTNGSTGPFNPGGWTNNLTVGNRQWQGETGTTPSSNTGPSSGNGDNIYIYTETSNPVSPNDQFVLDSEVIDASFGSITFSFDYHMFINSASDSVLECLVWDGLNWNTEFTVTGQQQTASSDPWITQTINLSTYNNTDMQIRFVYTVNPTGGGQTWQNDVALDNLIVRRTLPAVVSGTQIGTLLLKDGGNYTELPTSNVLTLSGGTGTGASVLGNFVPNPVRLSVTKHKYQPNGSLITTTTYDNFVLDVRKYGYHGFSRKINLNEERDKTVSLLDNTSISETDPAIAISNGAGITISRETYPAHIFGFDNLNAGATPAVGEQVFIGNTFESVILNMNLLYVYTLDSTNLSGANKANNPFDGASVTNGVLAPGILPAYTNSLNTGTLIDINSSADINLATVTLNRSFFCVVEITDTNTLQCIYEEGAGVRGLSLAIESGSIVFNVWNADTNDGPGDDWGSTSSRGPAFAATPITPGVYYIGCVYNGESGDNLYDGTVTLYIGDINNPASGLTKIVSTGAGKLYIHPGDVNWLFNDAGYLGFSGNQAPANFLGKAQVIGYSPGTLTDADHDTLFSSLYSSGALYGVVGCVSQDAQKIIVTQRTGLEIYDNDPFYTSGTLIGSVNYSIANEYYTMVIDAAGHNMQTVYDYIQAKYAEIPASADIKLALAWGKGEQTDILYKNNDTFYTERVSSTGEGVLVCNYDTLNSKVSYFTDDNGVQSLQPALVKFTISNVVPGSEVRIFNAVTKEEIAGVETLAGTEFVYNYLFTGTTIPIYVVVMELSQKVKRLTGLQLTNFDQTIPANTTEDLVYKNP